VDKIVHCSYDQSWISNFVQEPAVGICSLNARMLTVLSLVFHHLDV
jgi:hypothetical protein